MKSKLVGWLAFLSWLVNRWSGRNHREKIRVHVSFDQLLNMEPYCCREPKPVSCSSPSSPGPAGLPRPKHFLYDLSAVVMHHGKGFGSGHYTSYCYNTGGGEWRGFLNIWQIVSGPQMSDPRVEELHGIQFDHVPIGKKLENQEGT